MNNNNREVIILIADDDADDRLMTKEALEESHLKNEIRFVVDGEDLMDYLNCRGKYSAEGSAPRPGIILLDLNMPKKDGREALSEIKNDPLLRQIPVIVLTTSHAEEDIFRTYDLGVNAFITKPVSFSSFAGVMKTFAEFWFEIVALPSAPSEKY